MGDFAGGPVVKTPSFHFRGHVFDPWSGTKIPHAVKPINQSINKGFSLKKNCGDQNPISGGV